MKNKVLLMIADGLGDRPCEELGWKTPWRLPGRSSEPNCF